jgi:KTSC domain
MIVDFDAETLETLPWEAVASSQIERVAWVTADGSTQLGWNSVDLATEEPQEPTDENEKPHLVVQFRSRGPEPSVYVYAGVPKEAYEELRDAPSVGRQLNASVKGTFPYAKMRVAAPAPTEP